MFFLWLCVLIYSMLIWQITITVLSLFIDNLNNIKDIVLMSDLFALFVY